ncbi:Z-DNA-binding protein 1 isoform X4 [Balaenoptera ricei]|uniref:Z-DNA-binding protein 1 isoform X4 n=1 Tax=Balaenoptera ricei TaxID=2746895 RepID=UPI0028BDB6FB|nr:Z-DNA-binding protein 1 isoform X4 [Balaenoptera ricei]
MAEAPANPGDADLEQRILEVLRDSGSPVKTAQLVKKCQVPKKKLSQVLHKMNKESKGVLLVGPATWCLADGGAKEVVPAELAERPQEDAVAVPRKPGPELSQRQEEIFRFLETHGPQRALIIAQGLGMKTAKEVNPDLYAMRNKHLLDLDQKSNSWAIYQPEGSRNQSTPVIYQQNPINMISQNGPSSHISIDNSKGIQIGHGNVIVRKMASGENGSTAPLYLPPLAPTDPSTQGPLAGSWGPQDIRMEKSVLRHVQMGHGNEMSLHGSPAKGPAHSACGSPPDPPSGAARSRSEVPPGSSQAAPVNVETLISEELAAMTLQEPRSQKRRRSLLSDRATEPVSPEGGTQSKQPAGRLAQEGPGSQ